jgi:hypothetical protein
LLSQQQRWLRCIGEIDLLLGANLEVLVDVKISEPVGGRSLGSRAELIGSIAVELDVALSVMPEK